MGDNIDKEGMYEVLLSFPEQIEKAMKLGKKIGVKDVDKIVVAGMGGSGIGGEILKSYLDIKMYIIFFRCVLKKFKNFTNSSFIFILISIILWTI